MKVYTENKILKYLCVHISFFKVDICGLYIENIFLFFLKIQWMWLIFYVRL